MNAEQSNLLGYCPSTPWVWKVAKAIDLHSRTLRMTVTLLVRHPSTRQLEALVRGVGGKQVPL
jgi:hypothetical protein